jgi:hypothetical protein
LISSKFEILCRSFHESRDFLARRERAKFQHRVAANFPSE